MITFIWDLDGTLLDSYDAILAGLSELYDAYHLVFDSNEVKQYILQYSVQELLKTVAKKEGLDLAELNAYRANSLQEKNTQIRLMQGAGEVLSWSKQMGIRNFVYTHKGENAHTILNDLEIDHYFVEVITSADGFERKPHPAAIDYLVQKYHLDKSTTYYIGDRSLDIHAALNAGIQSINFQSVSLPNHQTITSLLEIKTKLFKNKGHIFRK